MKILQPPDYDHVDSSPVMFLAGPIQNAPDWQSDASFLIWKRAPKWDLLVANPRRDTPTEDRVEKEWSDDKYEAQVLWEHHYLDRAFSSGVVVFWLALEYSHDCKRAYAQTSRFELGEAMVSAHNLVVGIESGFSNERYIRTTLGRKRPQVPILNTLSDTIQVALDRIAPWAK